MLLILGYLAALLMGIVLGVIGGGGSILTVPILVYLMDVAPSTATGYSLLIVGATAAFGALRYFKEGLVDIKTATLFAIPSIIAVYLTRLHLMPSIPEIIIDSPIIVHKGTAIMVTFALLMLTSAFYMLRNASRSNASNVMDNGAGVSNAKTALLVVLEGAVIGVLTGILGAGGGFMIIPALVLLLKMPIKRAIGASLYIIALKSLLGFIGDLQAGIELDWDILPFILVATFLGMTISTKIAGKLDGQVLQKFFALFTLVLAIIILTTEFI